MSVVDITCSMTQRPQEKMPERGNLVSGSINLDILDFPQLLDEVVEGSIITDVEIWWSAQCCMLESIHDPWCLESRLYMTLVVIRSSHPQTHGAETKQSHEACVTENFRAVAPAAVKGVETDFQNLLLSSAPCCLIHSQVERN